LLYYCTTILLYYCTWVWGTAGGGTEDSGLKRLSSPNDGRKESEGRKEGRNKGREEGRKGGREEGRKVKERRCRKEGR
jgi:hypothetical protein